MKYPVIRNDITYALDLDGVIIDSILECYFLSSETYHKKKIHNNKEKSLFIKYRGLVGPPYQYYHLLRLINNHQNNEEKIVESFYNNNSKTKESDIFESIFFKNREKKISQNFNDWIKLNPLTDFGNYIKLNTPKNLIIITTKDRNSAVKILNHFNISYQMLYSNEDIKAYGSKGKILDEYLKKTNMKKIYFIDDHTNHLDSVENKNIKCFFAAWGYGTNNGYPEFN